MQTKEKTSQVVTIDAAGLYYRQLNEKVRQALKDGAERIILQNVCGQRYIGDGLRGEATIEIHGTPGNDMAMFMNGPTIFVHGNGQDGIGNTMTMGEIVIDGSVGDLLAHSLRGGRIYVRGSAGYRSAIHMKQYTEPVPAVVIGGTAGDYTGEYMAGGVLIILGLDKAPETPLTGAYLGTGMHNGAIYLRGDVRDDQMGKEISRVELNDADRKLLAHHVGRFADYFKLNAAEILAGPFVKMMATSSRPYGRLYVY
ncbi:MAG: hypothetical protein EHM48_01355 [Planctomycetaceae bacterium]|nr:MAG: hypothetical protein EHM48_01355 [Planctomycetaceae bacterium]